MMINFSAIRQDRTRGGRSSYEGCSPHLKTKMTAADRKLKRLAGGYGLTVSQTGAGGNKSHKNLVAILNHSMKSVGASVAMMLFINKMFLCVLSELDIVCV